LFSATLSLPNFDRLPRGSALPLVFAHWLQVQHLLRVLALNHQGLHLKQGLTQLTQRLALRCRQL